MFAKEAPTPESNPRAHLAEAQERRPRTRYSDAAMTKRTTITAPDCQDPSAKYDPSKSQKDRISPPADCPALSLPWPKGAT
mmetsp:Transcript_51737/g.166568  ORF Transcript_51737/g.166568 Transcript_51737/m.166568 type:complete len:81 (-) Transcript_51737:722-964(-)